jgi:hypothetical protein
VRDQFSTLKQQWQEAGVVESLTMLSQAYPSFSDTGTFARVDHRQLQLPVPALAMLLSDCGGAEGARRMGFENLGRRDPEEPLPQAESLAMRLPAAHELALYIRDPDQPMRAVSQASLEVAFPDVHPRPWLSALWNTGRMALIASPRVMLAYDTVGAWLLASWIILVTVPEHGHDPALR